MSLIVKIEKKLKNFTLKVNFKTQDTCLGILGASGCGKSMTLKCIAGIVTPDKGYIELNGKVLFDSAKKINLPPQQRKVGYLFQNYALFPNMTVYDNIGIGIKAGKKEKHGIIQKFIRDLKLEGLEDQYPSKLSGGQQQRVALARMLAYEPDVLLFDEPFSAMDSYLKEELQIQLQELLEKYHGDAILVTHSRDEVYRFCKDLMLLDGGSILEKGKTKEIFASPKKVQTARLTGCKNISRAMKLSENKVEALDWGQVLTVHAPIPTGLTHIGIRAHDFKIDDTSSDGTNRIPCRIHKILESPFEWNVLVQLDNLTRDNKKLEEIELGDGKYNPERELEHQGESILWWKIGKNQLGSGFREEFQTNLTVAPRDIQLLE